MSFLTAASLRSRRGSGVSGASSFSFSLGAAFALLAMHFSWTPVPDNNRPLPYAWRLEMADIRAAPERSSDSAFLEVSARVIKPRLTLQSREAQADRENSDRLHRDHGSQRPNWSSRQRSKALDQRLGSFGRSLLGLYILQPGI